MQMKGYDIGHNQVENVCSTPVYPGKLSCFNFMD